jgi:hypothetical protein
MEEAEKVSRLGALLEMYGQAIAGLEEDGADEALLADVKQLRQETLEEIEALRAS